MTAVLIRRKHNEKTFSVVITFFITIAIIIGDVAVFNPMTAYAAGKKQKSYTLPVQCTTYYRVGKEGKWKKDQTVTYKYDKYGNVKSYTVDGSKHRIKNRYKNKMLYASSSNDITRYYGSNGACIRQITLCYKKGILKGEVVTNFESNRKGFVTKASMDKQASSSYSVINKYGKLAQAEKIIFNLTVKKYLNGKRASKF